MSSRNEEEKVCVGGEIQEDGEMRHSNRWKLRQDHLFKIREIPPCLCADENDYEKWMIQERGDDCRSTSLSRQK